MPSENPFLLILALILAAIAVLGLGFLGWQMYEFNKLRRTFFAGKNALDLEQVLNIIAKEVERLQQNQTVLEHNLAVLENNFHFAVQKVGVIRFNPFADGGGNLSFSMAILDGTNSGVVITSMHGREQNRIYTKRIMLGKSEVQLTEEEEQAVRAANQDKTKISEHH